MSAAAERMPLEPARTLALQLVEALRPACDRIEIAGSIRRGMATVGDIELVVIPTFDEVPVGLFGECRRRTLLDLRLAALLADGRLIAAGVNGTKYRRYALRERPGLLLDLSIVTPETWGVLLPIRTGPAAYSKRLVTRASAGGLLQNAYYVSLGRVWRRDAPEAGAIETPEELDFLNLAGGWV